MESGDEVTCLTIEEIGRNKCSGIFPSCLVFTTPPRTIAVTKWSTDESASESTRSQVDVTPGWIMKEALYSESRAVGKKRNARHSPEFSQQSNHKKPRGE